MNPFKSKIKCIHCGKNYKKRKDRNKIVYICQSYDNYSQCKRIPISHDFLVAALEKRYEKVLTDEEIERKVKRIEIEDRLLFTIYLTDQEPIIYGRTKIVF